MIPLQQFHAISSGGASQVQVAFGAAGTTATDTLGTLNVAFPTGIAVGHLLVIHATFIDASDAAVSTPAGWTAVTTALGSTAKKTHAWYKIATGSESGTESVNWGSSPTGAVGRMYRFTVSTGIESAGGAADATSGTAMTAVDVTSTVNLALAVQLFSAEVNATIGDITGESGGDYTEAVAEAAGTSPINYCLQLQTATLAAPASITGGSATLGSAGTNRRRMGFVIKP